MKIKVFQKQQSLLLNLEIIGNLRSMSNNHRSLWLLEGPALKAKATSYAKNWIFENSNYPIWIILYNIQNMSIS
jgi:hypothetical protein